MLLTVARRAKIPLEQLRDEAERRTGRRILHDLSYGQARAMIQWVQAQAKAGRT